MLLGGASAFSPPCAFPTRVWYAVGFIALYFSLGVIPAREPRRDRAFQATWGNPARAERLSRNCCTMRGILAYYPGRLGYAARWGLRKLPDHRSQHKDPHTRNSRSGWKPERQARKTPNFHSFRNSMRDPLDIPDFPERPDRLAPSPTYQPYPRRLRGLVGLAEHSPRYPKTPKPDGEICRFRNIQPRLWLILEPVDYPQTAPQ